MKKILIILLFIFFLSGIFAICQEPVQEHVEVKWWVVPLFAVDNQGNPVLDLKPGDLEISLDRHKLDEFVLIKRDFAISRSKSETMDTGSSIAPPGRKKMIFLLFDNAVSGRETIDRSRSIAREIVQKAKPGGNQNISPPGKG